LRPVRRLFDDYLLSTGRVFGVGATAKALYSPGQFVASVERPGAARTLGEAVLAYAVSLLRRFPRAAINCKISAPSVVDGDPDARLDGAIGDDQAIGGRLILSVRGAAGLSSFRRVRAFRDAARSRNTLLALSGLDGARRDARREALIPPNIIKVRDEWLEDAQNRGSVGALQWLVPFARQHGPAVAVGGVSHLDHRLIADACNIDWWRVRRSRLADDLAWLAYQSSLRPCLGNRHIR
jgi:EAL domain-containing protein (putative c-di-GMP-specific phosphodiesterase class I)